MASPRNAREEAQRIAGDRGRALVLEPSPPAVAAEPFADDPPALSDAAGAVVSPIARTGAADLMTWDELAASDPAVAGFAAARWLGAWSRLRPLPAGFGTTRLGLHRVAAYVMSPARRQVNGKIGLRHTMGGFGTPFFSLNGTDTQIRVEGTELVRQSGDGADAFPLTTLNAAGAAIGIEPDVAWASEFDIPEPGGLDDDLGVDAESASVLADWYGFAYSVLEELRADEASVDASNPQLWPEHFDPAIEVGSDEAKHRGSYGFSPGDAEGGNAEPYIYVSAWYPDDALDDDPFWNSTTYPGAILTYAELLAADDQRATALAFMRRGRDLIAS
ncbi:MAG: hypothetical protein AAF467_25320 [Actinomycetota bacterium]